MEQLAPDVSELRIIETVRRITPIKFMISLQELQALRKLLTIYLTMTGPMDLYGKAMFIVIFRLYERTARMALSIRKIVPLKLDVPTASALFCALVEIKIDLQRCPYENNVRRMLIEEIDRQSNA